MLVTADLSYDTVYSLLADDFRRFTLYYLVFEADGEGVAPDELIEYLRTVSEKSINQEDTLRVRLHHAILPHLQDTGLIDYDTRSEMIRYRGHPQLEVVLIRTKQIKEGDEDNGQNER
ncbi:hypothetical protein [Haladaptatus sp. DYF46]|uniref:DUF7344 domain-containing protein n=1 Tax=Haladaptatus sp. DYF46 TaxID=2886041 RepID=UPI001E452DAB|nr:hypothetical protein [Haladaptatus sp. DYF46]